MSEGVKLECVYEVLRDGAGDYESRRMWIGVRGSSDPYVMLKRAMAANGIVAVGPVEVLDVPFESEAVDVRWTESGYRSDG